MKHFSYKNLTLLSGITKHLNISFGKVKERDVNTPFNQEGKHISLDEINFLFLQVIEPGKGKEARFTSHSDIFLLAQQKHFKAS